jgi:phage baseplate assembly protein W
MIERAILFFEPRITLDRIVVCSEEMAQGLIEIELTYTIRTTNTRSNMVYPFYFLEGTNLPLR